MQKEHSTPNLQVLRCRLVAILLFQFAALTGLAGTGETISDANAGNQTIGSDIRVLKPGETIERQATANDQHSYRIALEAGTTVEITFGDRDIGFLVTALIPDDQDRSVPDQRIPSGTEFAKVAVGAGLVEQFVIAAEKTGDYVISVRAMSSGTYSFSCSKPHITTESDRKYSAAEKLFVEIRRTYESPTLRVYDIRDKVAERVEIYRSLGDKKGVALSTNDLALAYSLNGDSSTALKYLRESLAIFRELNSVDDINLTLDSIARLSTTTGDYQTSIDNRTEALAFYRSKGNKKVESRILHSLGVVYHLLADELKAREFYEQALLVDRSITPVDADLLNSEAVTLINIGNLYRGVEANEIVMDAFGPRTADDRQKALEYYKQALEIARRIKRDFPGAQNREGYNLLQIGNTYKELGNYSEALVYLNQALEGYKASRSAGQIYCLMGLGNLFALQGDSQKSFENYERAIELLKNGADNQSQAKYLNMIAEDYYRAGEIQKALDLLNEALELSRNRQQPMVSTESLFETARIERDLGNFNNARKRIEDAIQTVESLRSRITSQDVRTIFFSAVKRYYDFYIDLLMQAHKSQPEKGFDALALRMSEQARSRSLLDLLTLSRIDIKQGVDPALIERERSVRERIAEKANQQNRLLLGKHTEEETEKIKTEVLALTAEYQEIQSQIRNKSPRYAALTQPTALNTKQIQELLDSGTILLEYSLGEKKSYLWLVAPDLVMSFDLPKREEIETQARIVYKLLTARNQNPKNETDEQKRVRIKSAEEEYPKAAAKLTQILLGPAASQLGNKRLLVVPDGALNYIPFSALPSPKHDEPVPLGVNHEIVTLPSASILALLREETRNRRPAPKMVAVFADPVFDQTDTRFSALTGNRPKTIAPRSEIVKADNGKKTPSFSRDFERAVLEAGLISSESSGLPRLPFSRREADSIFRVAPRNLSLRQVDFEASKSEVFRADLERYRILHFATHGLLNGQHPELSGVVLSLFDQAGRETDGFLRLQDIYNLKLSADLVVLSACNTALGKDVKGEGLIGLTRGFMYSGAPRVVASLWKVDDAATAELMGIFYRKMLIENLRPAAALRAAQTEMMKQTRWKSAYYWAPFIIEGEWK